jgi:hypothetical protein
VFPFGGPLADLSPYVLQTVPDAGAAPVFRAYDLACTFSTATVPQLYGGDLVLRLSGDDGRPVPDASGADLVLDCAWQQAPTITVSDPDAAWLARLTACAGLPGAPRGDDLLSAGLPAGTVLPSRRTLTARLCATRPLYTDPFTDLAAFEQQVLATGTAVSTCTATNGVATIARPHAHPDAVAALAGDPDNAGYTVTGTARPRGEGSFGLVVGHSGPDRWVALELTVGGGRRLVSATPAGPVTAQRVLWWDDGPVVEGTDYALALTCAGGTVTASIDDLTVAVPAAPGPGRFGLLSAIPGPHGCEIRDLVVRSAPPSTVHTWRFTTSAYLGLPELLATFTGLSRPAPSTVDSAALRAGADSGAARLAAVATDVAAARGDLATAVATGNTVDLGSLITDALEAVDRQHAAAADVYQALSAALGLDYRPSPPLVEVLTARTAAGTVALVLDLPEPVPWERMSWSLTRVGPHPSPPLADALLTWSGDGAHAVIVRAGGAALASGEWSLRLELAMDVGAERVAWTRAGSTAPEVVTLRFALP